MRPLLDDEAVAFVASGCALVVGTSTADGEPVATRGWGCDVVAVGPDSAELRLLVDRDDERAHGHVGSGTPIAVTATSVPTLRSLQLKGRVRAVVEADEADVRRAARYCDEFYADITATDGTERTLLDRMLPTRYQAWVVDVGDLYDQTPGPGAGASLLGRPR